jgi:hypothetical protein
MTGRPSDFTDEIATRICDLLMDGLSMRSICQADDMPHRTTVVRWLERYPEFASMYAHARTLQADLMDDMILETANACTPATAQAANHHCCDMNTLWEERHGSKARHLHSSAGAGRVGPPLRIRASADRALIQQSPIEHPYDGIGCYQC